MFTYLRLLQILLHTFRTLVFRDVSHVGNFRLQRCQPAKQQRCGNFKFFSCYYPVLTRSDHRGQSVFIVKSDQQYVSLHFLFFSQILNTFKTMLILQLMNLSFYY
jgi:hypothetical protein